MTDRDARRSTRFLAAITRSFAILQPASAADKCLKINTWYPQQVLAGNESNTGKLSLEAAAAVKSPDFKNVYFVAIKFKATGVGSQTGVWAINGKLPQKAADLVGVTLAVDPYAQQFTVWPDADRTAAKISRADRSVAAAKSCLKR